MPLADTFAVLKRKLEEATVGDRNYKIIKLTYGKDKNSPVLNQLKLFSWPVTGGNLSERVVSHYGLGPEGKTSVVCPTTFGPNESCPICDFCDAAGKSGDASQLKIAERVRKAERYLILACDWGEYLKENKAEIGVYSCSKKIHNRIMTEMINQEFDFTAWENCPLVGLTGFQQGRDTPPSVEFSIVMKGLNAVTVNLDPNEWIPLSPDVNEIRKLVAPRILQALLDGKDPSASESEPTPEREQAPAQQAAPTQVQQPAATTVTPAASTPAATPAPTAKKSLADLIKRPTS